MKARADFSRDESFGKTGDPGAAEALVVVIVVVIVIEKTCAVELGVFDCDYDHDHDLEQTFPLGYFYQGA